MSPENNTIRIGCGSSERGRVGRVQIESSTTSGPKLSATKSNDDEVQQCLDKYADFPLSPVLRYCNATFDSFLCWPPTPEGDVATQNCPPARLSDTTRLAFRRCGDGGLWLDKRNQTSGVGWTNYTPCFPPEVQTLFIKVYDVSNEKDGQLKFEIAQRTRYMEIAGFSISLIALIISLVIFSYYRSLRNNRTKIHKSLFGAMVAQVIIRLTLYIDQALIRSTLGDQSTNEDVPIRGIDNMPYICEASYILLEYAITAMFMWMFIEGLYLHNVVTANALRDGFSHLVYYATGWGLPVVLTALWGTTTAILYSRDDVKKCWYGYNFSPLYWIMQGPRLAVIMINFVFLLNIMRVLIVKLRKSDNSEVEKVRKAVRAALVLLPLLGITNLLNMTEAPLDGSVWEFGLWSYSTHFLRSFQGFFIALIYCFLNGEVRQVMKKHYVDYMAMRTDLRRQRDTFQFTFSSGENRNKEQTPSRLPWSAMRNLRWIREPSPDNDLGDVEREAGCSYASKQKEALVNTNVDEQLPTAPVLNDGEDFVTGTEDSDGIHVDRETQDPGASAEAEAAAEA